MRCPEALSKLACPAVKKLSLSAATRSSCFRTSSISASFCSSVRFMSPAQARAHLVYTLDAFGASSPVILFSRHLHLGSVVMSSSAHFGVSHFSRSPHSSLRSLPMAAPAPQLCQASVTSPRAGGRLARQK